MRLSKGFEKSDYNRLLGESHDNSETSSLTALSKGNSLSTLDNISHANEISHRGQSKNYTTEGHSSPNFGQDEPQAQVQDFMERKRSSKTKFMAGNNH